MWETIINILIFIMMFSLGFFLPKTALSFIILVRCATSTATNTTEIALIGCMAGIMTRELLELIWRSDTLIITLEPDNNNKE